MYNQMIDKPFILSVLAITTTIATDIFLKALPLLQFIFTIISIFVLLTTLIINIKKLYNMFKDNDDE